MAGPRPRTELPLATCHTPNPLMKHRKLHATKFGLISGGRRLKRQGQGGGQLRLSAYANELPQNVACPLPDYPLPPFCLTTHFCWNHFALKFHARKSIKNFRSSSSAGTLFVPLSLSLSPSLFFAFSHPPTCLFLFAAALQLILSHAFDQIQLKVKRTTRVRGNYSVSHSHSHSYVFVFALTT